MTSIHGFKIQQPSPAPRFWWFWVSNWVKPCKFRASYSTLGSIDAVAQTPASSVRTNWIIWLWQWFRIGTPKLVVRYQTSIYIQYMFPWPCLGLDRFWSNATKKMLRDVCPLVTSWIYSVLPWFTHGLPMVYPWFTHGLPMVYPWFTQEFKQAFPEVLPGLGFSPQLRYCKWPADGPSQVEPGHLGSPKRTAKWRTSRSYT